MPKLIKTLFKSKRNEPSAEEVEALDRATFVLRCRVERMVGRAEPEALGQKAA